MKRLVLLALVVLAACAEPMHDTTLAPGPTASVLPARDGVDVTVASITDGDTIRVHYDPGSTATVPVRLIGIDTPETRDPRRPVGCFGKEASDHLASLIPPGTPVQLVYDVERQDSFDRTLAYVVRLSDGLFVNLAMAEGGYANAMTVPPNVAFQTEIRKAVQAAREARRGLWGAC